MKKHYLAGLVLLLTSFYTVAQSSDISGNFTLNETNTSIRFSAKHFGVITVTGEFTAFEGQVSLQRGLLQSGTASIQTSSISTGNGSRDRSLKSSDFLDALNHPKIELRFGPNQNRTELDALLAIKNVKQILTVPYELSAETDTALLKVSCLISRKKFKLNFGAMDELVSDEVKITGFITLKVN